MTRMGPEKFAQPDNRRSTALSAATVLIGSALLLAAVATGYSKLNKDSALYEGDSSKVSAPELKGGINAEIGQKTVVDSPEKSTQAIGMPQRIIIADIGVNTKIVNVGIGEAGKIETPINQQEVGWLNNTKKPGDPGLAVLIGEYALNSRTVFSSLEKLRVGQKILVVDDADVSIVFEVISTSGSSDYNIDEDLNSSDETPKIKLLAYKGSSMTSSSDLKEVTVVTAAIVR